MLAKKWFLNHLPYDIFNNYNERVERFFLSYSPDIFIEKIANSSDTFYLKYIDYSITKISLDEFEFLLKKARSKKELTRYHLDETTIISVFKYSGLSTIQKNFHSYTELLDFKKPEWFGKELK